MIARYGGKCSICHNHISPGQSIRHTGRRKNAHSSCSAPRLPSRPPTEYKPSEPSKELPGQFDIIRRYNSWDRYLNEFDAMGEVQSECRDTGSSRETGDFNGYVTYQEAKELARMGWQDGVSKVRDISAPMMDKIGSRIERLDPYFTIEPGAIEFGRYFDGEPECCLELTPTLVQGPGKFVNILMNGTVSWSLEEWQINLRGATILALIELLEYSGCRVQLTLLYHFQGHDNVGGKVSAMSHYIILKPYEQPLDYNRLSFTALHPAALRRLQFRVMEHEVEGNPSMARVFAIPGGYGLVHPPRAELTEGYDIYFEHLVPATCKFTDKESSIAYITEQLLAQGVTLS